MCVCVYTCMLGVSWACVWGCVLGMCVCGCVLGMCGGVFMCVHCAMCLHMCTIAKTKIALYYLTTTSLLLSHLLFLIWLVQKALQQVKDGISQLSKKNFKLERDLKFLDSKIALLINHKISIEVCCSTVCLSVFTCVVLFVCLILLIFLLLYLFKRDASSLMCLSLCLL